VATASAHRPVLLEESLQLLALRPNTTIIDGTAGGGGHAVAILEATSPGGHLIALDRDAFALETTRKRLAEAGFLERTSLCHASFRDLGRTLDDLGVSEVDGVLFDLGVSSFQLDTPERGFRFSGPNQDETPLDMRMDTSVGETAADLLARASAEQLQSWFSEYGELPGSKRLARTITEMRRERPLRTSRDLLDAIREAGVGRGRKHHPGTLVFQALRIAVNDELGALVAGIEAGIERLRPGGRFAVLAYHSIEDRIVKNCFRNAVRGCTCPPHQPVCTCGGRVRLKLVTKRPLTASDGEVRENPRARSVRLRAAERIGEAA